MTDGRTACIVGFLSFLLAAGTIHLTSDGRDIATVWPANAVVLAALLDRRPAAWAGRSAPATWPAWRRTR